MRTIKLIWSLLLIFSLSLTATAQGKKIGASGVGTGDKSGSNSGDKPKKVIGATGVIKGEDTTTAISKPPPPPKNPSLSRLVVIAPNIVGGKVNVKGTFYELDKDGASKFIDIKPGEAKLTLEHPDFEPFTESIILEKGKAITKVVNLISKYGDVKLGGIPEGSAIFIDGEEKPIDSIKREGEEISLRRIPVGVRKLKITHPDYITREEELDVKPGEELTDAKGLILATADLTLASTAGAEVYIDDESKGKVLPDGTVVINAIKPGERKIRVVKDGYEEKMLVEKLAIGPKALEVKLVPIPNTGEFFEDFNVGLKAWNAPSDWGLAGAKLIVKGQSKLGVPNNKIFRDLDGAFSLKMLNGKGIAWALRVNGKEQNYYLFHLSGPSGKTPNVIRTYICQDGKLDLNNFARSTKVNTITLSPEYFYRIRISVRGNKIETFMTANQGPEAGTEIPIDVFIDESNTFTYGNIAFTTIDGEEVMIDDVGVKPIETAEEKAAKEQKASK